MLPSKFIPQQLTDFIGPARAVGQQLDKLITLCPDGPLKVMLLGKPGIGKTELGNWFERRLKCDKWSVCRYNGTQVRIEEVEAIGTSLHYKDLFGAWRLVRVEEVDKVPVVAQVRFLSLLDDLPPRTAVFCTSNCTTQELEERFQSRFNLFQVKPPTQTELQALVARLAPGISREWLASIAMSAMGRDGRSGNVRQALLDADRALVAA